MKAPAVLYAAFTLLTAGLCEQPSHPPGTAPPDYRLDFLAACGPSPEGDCCSWVFGRFFYDGFESGDTSAWGGGQTDYPHRRICCGGGCNNHYPASGDSPELPNEEAYRRICAEVSVPGAPP